MKAATREAYGIALEELGAENKNIVVLDADLSKSTKTAGFKNKYPERFFNMGISEADMMGTAGGLATTGMTVFASTFAIFAAGRAYEQIRNTIAYSKLNVKIAATHAGLSVGEDGASHQSIEDIALMRVIPNMKVFSPCDYAETKAVIKYCSENDGPAYIRLGRLKTDEIFNEDTYNFEFGKGVQLQDGNDVCIVTTGLMTSKVLEANEMLKEKNINARIINIHTIKPLDKNIIIKAAKEIGKIVVVEEHSVIGGLGSAVCEVLSQECPVPVKLIGVNDEFGTSGKAEEVLEKYGLDSKSIANKIEKFTI